jgi:hypothetical protein
LKFLTTVGHPFLDLVPVLTRVFKSDGILTAKIHFISINRRHSMQVPRFLTGTSELY